MEQIEQLDSFTNRLFFGTGIKFKFIPTGTKKECMNLIACFNSYLKEKGFLFEGFRKTRTLYSSIEVWHDYKDIIDSFPIELIKVSDPYIDIFPNESRCRIQYYPTNGNICSDDVIFWSEKKGFYNKVSDPYIDIFPNESRCGIQYYPTNENGFRIW